MSFNSTLNHSNNSSISSSLKHFDFEGLEESLVDLNESNESINETTPTTTREQSFHKIRNSLIRDSNNRTEEDLDLIQNFLSLIIRQKNQSSLLNKDFHTKRLLARNMVLAEIESRDTRVLTDGERLDAYCIVACGSLRHIVMTTEDDSCVDCVDDKCCHNIKVRYLSVGDEFGANLDDRVVFGEIFTNEDFVWVLCVPHIIFDEICGEKSFKTVFDEKNEKILEIRNQFTNELIRATKQRLLDLLFLTTVDDTDDTTETEFISDFLLTFRLFWSENKSENKSIEELMEKICENLKNEINVEKHVKIVLFWISNHFQDFSKRLLTRFESSLRSKIHKKLFYFTLSSKSRERHVTITRSDRSSCLPFTLIGGYECSTRLFISDVTDDTKDDICRGDRLLSINGVDCHVMEVQRALQLCRASTHLSLFLKFDPNLFHMLLDGQISRNSDTKRHLSSSDLKTTQLTTTHSSFASLKPIQQLSSQQTLQPTSNMSSNNNNWKQKVRQIVQNVNKNIQNINNNNNSGQTSTSGVVSPLSPTTPTTGQQLSTTEATPDVIKIYYESDFRYLPIHVTTTARECIQLALIEFQLNSSYCSRDFALFEYKLIDAQTATSAVKRLSDNFQNLVQNLSLNSRIYLKCISAQNEQINDAEVTREITRESNVNSLLTLDSEAIARELTSRDFELFCKIESQQFVYDLTTTDDNNSPLVTTVDDNRKELKEFENQTNSELFWTINRILFEVNSQQKRVKIVKQLIKIALICLKLNNFNTLFAILSGLSHQSVQRLKNLWEKIPQKSLNKLKKLYKLMDPSKNFLEFRQQLRHCNPPIIPFFPLVKKDLSFIDLANQTFLTCEQSKTVLINWEKMRLLGHKCREVQQMTTQSSVSSSATTLTTANSSGHTLSSSVAKEAFNQLKHLNIDSKEANYRKVWEKQRMRKRVQHFLDKTFSEIISDENVLFDKSLECEPQPQQQQTTTTTANDRLSVVRSSQLSNSSSMSSTTTASQQAVMPSPTPSSHSSSPSLSSSTTNSSDIQSSSSRLRFGIRDDTGLRKLLALSDNCVSVSQQNNNPIQRPQSHSSYHQMSSFVSSLPTTTTTTGVVTGLSSVAQQYKPILPEESSSVTSLRRLEQIQQISRFREQFIPNYNDLNQNLSQFVSNQRTGRPLLPSYDQTIQRMKKKFNKNEENIV